MYKGKGYKNTMVDFNANIPMNNGQPELDKDYWKEQKQKAADNNHPVFETNIKATFTDLDNNNKISIFKKKN